MKWTRGMAVRASALVVGFGLFGFSAMPAQSLDKFVALGTESKPGVYHSVGKGICGLLNKRRDETLVRCLTLNTGGTVYNIQAITTGELNAAIVQADLLSYAFRGAKNFKAQGENKDLRVIAHLYRMPVHVVVKQDADVNSYDSLPGVRLNIGNQGSGERALADILFTLQGWRKADFAEIHELNTSQYPKAFCDGKIDAFIEVIGLPSAALDRLISDCGAVLLPMPKNTIHAFRNLGPFYKNAKIRKGEVRGHTEVIRTVRIAAVLATSVRTHPDTVYHLTSAIMDNFAKFQNIHPTLKAVSMGDMYAVGSVVPYHSGALKYYKSKERLK